jgi:hypothetical protein
MNSPQNQYKWITVLCVVSTLWLPRAFAQSSTNISLAWSPSPATGIVGYNVYSGAASKNYTNMVSAGNVTNANVTGLKSGKTYYFSVTAVDTLGLESQFSNEISYSVPTNNPPGVSNTPPTVSSIANQTINANTSTGPLAFMIGDAQTPAANLTVSASSSNPTLVPAANIALSGSGSVWTITVIPAAGQTGTSTIAVTVCDPSLCTTTNFLVTVIPLPTITLSSPTSGGSFTAPATVSLAANVTANGHSITAVQFFNGSTLLGQASSAPYTFTWANVGAGNYSVMAEALYDAGNTVSSSSATISVGTAPSLPLPWQTSDIGNPSLPGNVTSSNGTFTVQGSGNMSGSSDNFRFVYQNLSGDGEIRARISSAQHTGGGDLTGVMIRESLTSGSKFALMGLSPGGPMRWLRRTNTGSGTSSSKAGNATPPNVWVRVVRSGNTLSGYKSVDGVNWNQVNSVSITMAANIYIGLAVASGATSTLATSLFTNVTVVP